MIRTLPRVLAAAAAVAVLAVSWPAAPAHAQTAVKIGGLRTFPFLAVMHAQKQGYFKREGLDVEVIAVNSGPAVVSALMGGTVQVGYSASLPPIFARAANQPVRIFSQFSQESNKPGGAWTWLMASERSGVKSVKDLAGKTVAINATGALCELLVREHLARAGVAWDSVKKIVVPFPQTQAALQLGNADAACLIEPFRSNVRVAPEIRAVELGGGAVPGATSPYALDVLFVREDWGRANVDTLRRVNRGMEAALKDFRTQPGLLRRLIAEEFKLSPAAISLMKYDMEFTELRVGPADVRPLLEGLARHKLLPASLRPEDVILELK